MENSVARRPMAAWTALRAVMTVKAPASATAPISTKMTSSTTSGVPGVLVRFRIPAGGSRRALPGHHIVVSDCAARGSGPQPSVGGEEFGRIGERIVGEHVRHATLAVHQQLGPGVDGVIAVGGRHLEEVGHGDGLGRAGLDAQPAEDATKHVDLVDEAVPLTRTDRFSGGVVGPSHIDAASWTGASAQLTADAFLHPIPIPIEDVASVEALRFGPHLFRVFGGHDVFTADPAGEEPSSNPEAPPDLVNGSHQVNSREVRIGEC